MKTLEELWNERCEDLSLLACLYPSDEDIMEHWRRADIDVDTLSLEDVLCAE